MKKIKFKKIKFKKIKDVLVEAVKERKITFEQVAEIYEINKTLISNYQAAQELKKEKMFKDVEVFNNGKCIFFPDENRAYLKRNDKMEYEYISEREKDKTYFSLNFLEMAEVVLEIDFYEALIFLIYETGTKTIENQWIDKYRKIYKENKEKVKDVRDFWVVDVTKDYEALVEVANENLKRGWVNSIEVDDINHPFFTISNEYFSRRIGKKKETARRSLIYLEAIGLIEKLDPEEMSEMVPYKLPKKLGKTIGIYRIIEVDSLVISEAIERIKNLNMYNITKGNITRKDLETMRGVDLI